MELENLETFIKVAETKSFSRSAEELSLTQPAISKRIAALESKLDVKLFDRVGRSVELTEAGHVMLPGAKQIQSEVSRIEDEFNDIGKELGGNLSIGTTSYVANMHLSPLLKAFREEYREVAIDLRLHTAEDSIQAVLDSNLELALCPLHASSLEKLPTGLRSIELWRDDLKLVVSSSSVLASNPVVSPEQLSNTTAILPPANTLARKAIDVKLIKSSVEATVSAQSDDFTTMRSLVSIGLGWACLPEHEIDNTLTPLHVHGFELPHAVVLICRRDRTLSRAATAFLESLSVEI